MSEKRKDNKGRILRKGESQRSDGRYMYKYKDLYGNDKYVYSWRLDTHDKVVPGKPKEECLREKEKRIQADLFNQLVPEGGGLTVSDLVDQYLTFRWDKAKKTTQAQYRTVQRILGRDSFGKTRIDRVKKMDAMAWLIKLQKEDGKGASSIKSIRGVLRPAFQMAFDNDYVRKNPFDFDPADVIIEPSKRREAIEPKQMREFLRFVKADKHFSKYYDAIYILFHTGLRISEFCGLTISDIDMENNQIHVNHQLLRSSEMEYYVDVPKTMNGARVVPMMDEVHDCFERILANRNAPQSEPIIDGYVGFLFFDKNGKPMVALHWEKYFQHICEKYNKIYRLQMPTVTPHVCRHTFCSNMARKRMNPKTLQKIMGHYDISVTLNTYTHLGVDDIMEEAWRVSNQNEKREKLYG